MNATLDRAVEAAMNLLLESVQYDETKSENHLQSCDADIGALQTAKDAIDKALIAKLVSRKRSRNRLAPISRLPIELLPSMLDGCLDSSPSACMARIYQLRLVCKWFQETIDNTASFWTTLSLGYPAAALADALQRSRNLLLTIITEIPTTDIDVKALLPLLEMVSGHVDRWQEVTLYLPQVRTLQQYLQGPAPFLKSVTLKAHNYFGYSPNDLDLSRLEANRLSKLTLDGMRFCWKDSLLQGLTEVDIRNLPVAIPRRQIVKSLSVASAL
ncbi:hypothetical protein FRC00_002309 [Tulasnella sp. 408]|nr:hypothetical protein FRC00_002309 [Tulasnella sp. 408]